MLSKVLKTPVDDLVELVKKKDNSSISYLRDQLKVTQDVIERWLVVLEEFKIISVHYKGFEGYVSMSVEEKKGEMKKFDMVDNLKDLYIDKAKEKKLSYHQMRALWPQFVETHKDELKALFEDKAKALGFEPVKVNKAWIKYEKGLETL